MSSSYYSCNIKWAIALRQPRDSVFASVLNTSLSTVRKWGGGEKHPTDPSLKLLSLLDRKGLEAVL